VFLNYVLPVVARKKSNCSSSGYEGMNKRKKTCLPPPLAEFVGRYTPGGWALVSSDVSHVFAEGREGGRVRGGRMEEGG